MAAKKEVVVGPMKVGSGKTVDKALGKGAEKAMLNEAMKSFKKLTAVKASKAKDAYQYEATLTTIMDDGGTLKCEIGGLGHPNGKLKPLAKATDSGEIKGGTARDRDALVCAVIASQVKSVEAALLKM